MHECVIFANLVYNESGRKKERYSKVILLLHATETYFYLHANAFTTAFRKEKEQSDKGIFLFFNWLLPFIVFYMILALLLIKTIKFFDLIIVKGSLISSCTHYHF